MNKELKIIYVEDSPAEIAEVRTRLKNAGYLPDIRKAENVEELYLALESTNADIVLTAYELASINARKVLSILSSREIFLPCIIIADSIGEEAATEIIHAGAHDYVHKDRLYRLIPAIEREMHEMSEKRKHAQIEQTFRNQRRQMEILNKIVITGNSASTVAELFEQTIPFVMESLNMDRAVVMRVDEKSRMASKIYCCGLPTSGVYDEVCIDNLPYSNLYIKGESHFMEDFSTISDEEASKENIASKAFIPLKYRDSIIGSLSLSSTAKHTFVEYESSFLLAVGRALGTGVGRIETENYLAERSKQIEDWFMMKEEAMAKAHMLQENITPMSLPQIPSINIGAFYCPSEQLGGDFFDIRKTDDKLIILSADCVGNGIEASMDATLLRAIIENFYKYLVFLSPDKFLQKINESLVRYMDGQTFPTLFASVLNISTKMLYYASANAPMPILIKNGVAKALEKPKGFHLGYDVNMIYEMKKVLIEKEDMLFVFSDALVELPISEEEVFGRDSVESIAMNLGKSINEDMSIVLDEIKKRSNLPLEDDLTLLFIHSVSLKNRKWKISSLDSEDEIKSYMDECLLYLGYSNEEILSFDVSFSELLKNAYIHGNKEDDSKIIEIEFNANCEQASFVITDEGDGFASDSVSDPTDYGRLMDFISGGTLDFESGRGIWLARHYSDKVTYSPKGNSVNALKYRKVAKTLRI